MVISDHEALAQELRKLPAKTAAIVGLRAAMRVLPVLVRGSEGDPHGFAFWQADRRQAYVIAIFRCCQTMVFVNSRTRTEKHAARAAAVAAHTAAAARDAASAARAVDTIDAVYSAAVAAYAAARSTSTSSEAAAHAVGSANRAAASAAAALRRDLADARRSAIERVGQTISAKRSQSRNLPLLSKPLWPNSTPAEIGALWLTMKRAVRALDAGFDIWIDWYEDRLIGKPLDLELEESWATISESRLTQSAADTNAYLKSLLKGEATEPLNRTRAIFIGHGGVGKTSLIRALHGQTVIEGQEAMTPGVAIQDSALDLDEAAGVFTHEKRMDGIDLTVHFWDFGGQVMAHATHQFFLREQCLYVIVLDARKERNANEEAEYWLEHVRAFGKDAPVMLVGNKSDQAQVNLDLRTLKQKYSTVVDFYPLSCTQAEGRFRAEFERFGRDFKDELMKLGTHAERFSKAQFAVLTTVREKAAAGNFLRHGAFDTICKENGIAADGPGGRASLLDLFDKLGIIMRFPQLPFFEEFVLNPRWLTYGVYQIIYSDHANAAKGRILQHDVVDVLKPLKLKQPDGTTLRYQANRCQLIVDAMIAFRVAFRLARDPQRLVIPALLEPQQPEHDFKADNAIAFQFDFKGFLPRNVLPTLIVEHHHDVARHHATGEEILWQNGILLRPDTRYDAEALIMADYHERNLDIFVNGSDASAFLGLIRDGILRTLKMMPELRYEEKVQLRPDMRDVDGPGMLGDDAVWMPYRIIQTALKTKMPALPGPDGHMYELDKIMRVMPVRPEAKRADIFISYTHYHDDRRIVDQLAIDLEKAGYSVWFDREMIGMQQFRDVIDQRIDAAKAVIAVWTEHSIGSKWVRHEADRAGAKLICLRHADLPARRLPAPFPANNHIIQTDDRDGLFKALGLLKLRPTRR